MARIRTIKPDSLQHRKVGRLSDRAFRLWICCLTQADDDGRLICDYEQLRILAFGYQKMPIGAIRDALQEIVSLGLLRIYSHGGEEYIDFPSWGDHQRIDRKTPSKLPEYNDSTNARRTLAADWKEGREGKERKEGSGEERKPARSKPLASSQAAAPLDDEWLKGLSANQAYAHVDVPREFAKCTAWCDTNKKLLTRRRFLNWLNRIEPPMHPAGGGARIQRTAADVRREQVEIEAAAAARYNA